MWNCAVTNNGGNPCRNHKHMVVIVSFSTFGQPPIQQWRLSRRQPIPSQIQSQIFERKLQPARQLPVIFFLFHDDGTFVSGRFCFPFWNSYSFRTSLPVGHPMKFYELADRGNLHIHRNTVLKGLFIGGGRWYPCQVVEFESDFMFVLRSGSFHWLAVIVWRSFDLLVELLWMWLWVKCDVQWRICLLNL